MTDSSARRRRRRPVVLFIATAVVAGISVGPPRRGASALDPAVFADSLSSVAGAVAAPGVTSAKGGAPIAGAVRAGAGGSSNTTDGLITIDTSVRVATLSHRLRGTNLAFYSGSAGFQNPTLQALSREVSGLTRYPGTQDSQRWGWASCQLGADVPNAVGCSRPNFTWTARPSDLISFVRGAGGEALVTVNANATARENAALVAFFNGSVGDTRVIGVDQRGADWKTVDVWAQERAKAGFPEPLAVTLWEFGNETYGGKPGIRNCVDFGWEATWTCNATEFLDGIGTGAAHHDGYRTTRAAMKAIDGSIQVGFPAARRLDDFNSWTREAIANHLGDVDFFVVHPYLTWFPPPNTRSGNAQILALPQHRWAEISALFRKTYNQYGSRPVPLLISEFNLTPGRKNDPSRRMNGIGNAIMMADSVGAMARDGLYLGANAFELYNVAGANSTYYAMIRRDEAFTRNPLYWGWLLWGRFGSSMVKTTSSFDASSQLSVYGGRIDANTASLYVLNKSGRPLTARVQVRGFGALGTVRTDEAVGTSMTDDRVAFNGRVNPSVDLSTAPPYQAALDGGSAFTQTFRPWSITLVRMSTVGSTPPASTTGVLRDVPQDVARSGSQPAQPSSPVANAAPTRCRVQFVKGWQGDAAFGGEGTVTNTGTTRINGWALSFSFPGSQRIESAWGASWEQSGQQVVLKNAGWNAVIEPGQTAGFGYQATFTGTNEAVPGWQINGQQCQ